MNWTYIISLIWKEGEGHESWLVFSHNYWLFLGFLVKFVALCYLDCKMRVLKVSVVFQEFGTLMAIANWHIFWWFWSGHWCNYVFCSISWLCLVGLLLMGMVLASCGDMYKLHYQRLWITMFHVIVFDFHNVQTWVLGVGGSYVQFWVEWLLVGYEQRGFRSTSKCDFWVPWVACIYVKLDDFIHMKFRLCVCLLISSLIIVLFYFHLVGY